jgi:hypothetical protein
MTQSRSPLLLLALALAASIQHVTSDTIASASVAAEPIIYEQLGDTSFAQLVERLSEPGGFFDSDNLISNEASYLHVMGKMRELGVKGGAYIGVGPDQNFSYIAQIRPSIAFIIDIRRDNLLHQLLFKALFEMSRNRLEYLCLLFGRPVPENLRRWDRSQFRDIIDYIDVMPARTDLFEASARRVRAAVQRYGVPLSNEDLDTIRRIHLAFHQAGLDLRFSSRGRPSRVYYPTYRDLLLATDLEGNRANYLATEESFAFLKDFQVRNRLIPVVGDLAGSHALAAIGREIARRRERVSAFYTSNVEYYLMIDRGFERYAETVSKLPFDSVSVIIRSYFGRGFPHPQNLPGFYATQLLERFETFVNEQRSGGYRTYTDLVNRHVLPLRDNPN